jgi:hypothetical protein
VLQKTLPAVQHAMTVSLGKLIVAALLCRPHLPFPAVWELFCSRRIIDSDEGLSVGQMFCMIAYQDWRPEVPPDCPPGYVELMTSCWHQDPEQRPTAQQLLRRLQKLQGQARQESMSARKLGTSQPSSVQPAGSQRLYSDSIPSGSETGRLQLKNPLTQRSTAGSRDSAQTGLSAEQLCAVGSTPGSGQSLMPFLAAPCYCAVCETVTQPDGGVEPAAETASSLHGAYALHAAHTTPVADDASRSATYVPEEHPQAAGLVPAHGSLHHLLMQLQSDPASRVCADIGFVSPYGEEFVGCLPDLPSSDEGSGHDIHSSYQPYIAALEAASASRVASTSAMLQSQ